MAFQVTRTIATTSATATTTPQPTVRERSAGGIIAADAPAGPTYRAKPGAAFVAKRAGVGLVPVGAALHHSIVLDSWDRFEIPRPFSAVVLTIGEMISVPEDAGEPELAALPKRLEVTLNDLTTRAELEAFATGATAAAAASRRTAAPRANHG